MATSVIAGPRPTSTARKSANVSPTVVERTLITQNVAVITGTLVSQVLLRGGLVVVVIKIISWIGGRARPSSVCSADPRPIPLRGH